MANRHFEAVLHRPGGGFALVSSSLTGRRWGGCLWVFSDMNDYLCCPNLDMVSTKTRTGNSDVIWLRNGRDILLACDSGELEMWNHQTLGNSLEYSKSLGFHDDMVLCLCNLSEKDWIVSGGADRKVIVWDLNTMKVVKSFRGHSDMVTSIASHPTSPDCFLSTAQDGSVKVWDLRLPKPARKFTACRDCVYTSASWCETSLALGTENGSVEVFDVREDPVAYASFYPHTRAVHRLAFAPWKSRTRLTSTCRMSISNLVASVSDDNKVCLKYINESGNSVASTNHSDFVRGLSWDPKEHHLLTCGWDGQLIQHSMEEMKDGLAPEHDIGSSLTCMEDGIETTDNKLGTKTLDTNIVTKDGNSCSDAQMDIETKPSVDAPPSCDQSPSSNRLNTPSPSNLSPDSKNVPPNVADTNSTTSEGVAISTQPSIDMFADSDDHCALETEVDGLDCRVSEESDLDKRGDRDSTTPEIVPSLVNNGSCESS